MKHLLAGAVLLATSPLALADIPPGPAFDPSSSPSWLPVAALALGGAALVVVAVVVARRRGKGAP